MTADKLALLGGEPEFLKTFPIIRPNYDKYLDEITPLLQEILHSNMVSGVNRKVVELEDKLCQVLEVDHVVAISSCTSGMILALQAAGLRSKEILIPSFSFSATAHMAYWNNASIKAIDCDPDTFNISLTDLRQNYTKKSKAVLAVHLYGNPCEINELEEFCEKKDLLLFFDAAHALGSKYKGQAIGGQGAANSFSASPTKLYSTVEGGFLTTNNEDIAEKVRIGRNYGNFSDYTCINPGLNARMTELQAAIGLVTLRDIPTFVSNRNKYAKIYTETLKSIPGVKFQKITSDSISTYKDYSIMINPETFGVDRNLLAKALLAENIQTKFYFFPPIHQLDAYAQNEIGPLPVTNELAKSVISLPIHNFMKEADIKRITSCIKAVHEDSDVIKTHFRHGS
ncbi:MAG: DegT/DnrJ/EryC1/StrS family aminotransferase [Promethearchaeota archaeon]